MQDPHSLVREKNSESKDKKTNILKNFFKNQHAQPLSFKGPFHFMS